MLRPTDRGGGRPNSRPAAALLKYAAKRAAYVAAGETAGYTAELPLRGSPKGIRLKWR